jgi:hypothetical protein
MTPKHNHIWGMGRVVLALTFVAVVARDGTAMAGECYGSDQAKCGLPPTRTEDVDGDNNADWYYSCHKKEGADKSKWLGQYGAETGWYAGATACGYEKKQSAHGGDQVDTENPCGSPSKGAECPEPPPEP